MRKAVWNGPERSWSAITVLPAENRSSGGQSAAEHARRRSQRFSTGHYKTLMVVTYSKLKFTPNSLALTYNITIGDDHLVRSIPNRVDKYLYTW